MRLVSYLQANPEEFHVCASSPRAKRWVHHHCVCLQPSLVLEAEHVALNEVHLHNTLPRVHTTSDLQRRAARSQRGSTELSFMLACLSCFARLPLQFLFPFVLPWAIGRVAASVLHNTVMDCCATLTALNVGMR